MNDDDIQTVVDIITETGCYEMSSGSFNFDLMQLEKPIIEKLETFTFTAVNREQSKEHTSLPLDFSIEDGKIAVTRNDDNKTGKMRKKIWKPTPRKIANDVVKIKKRKADNVQKKRKMSEFVVSEIKNKKNVKKDKSNADAKKRLRIEKLKTEKDFKGKQYHCLLCGIKRKSVNGKDQKYICRQCVKKRKKIIYADDDNVKKNRNGRCKRCVMKRKRITANDITNVPPVYSATLTPYYNLCATLALTPNNPLCDDCFIATE